MGSESFGAKLGDVRRRGLDVEIYQDGIRLVQGKREFSGRWEKIARVHYQQTQVTVNGRPMARKYLCQLVLPDGPIYSLTTDQAREGEQLSKIMQVAAPVLLKRDLSTFSSGAEVDLGAVRIGPRGLAVMKGRWRRIPLDQFAGWVLRSGHLLIDRKRASPRLFVEVPVGQVGNLFSLEAILGQVYPQGDYAKKENVRAAISRSSKLPWHNATVAKRAPGSFTRRGVFFTLFFLPALALLYAMVGLPWAIMLESYADEVDERFETVAAAGKKAFATLPASDPDAIEELSQACAGRLRYGPPDTIAAYFGPLPPEQAKMFPKRSRQKPERILVASNAYGGLKAEPDEREIWDRHDLFSAWGDILTEAPMDWGRRLRDPAIDHRDLSDTRYLAVTALRSLSMSQKNKAARARLFVRVIEIDGGQALCEGRVDFSREEPRRYGSSYGPTQLQRAPLIPVCQAGGDTLCETLLDRD